MKHLRKWLAASLLAACGVLVVGARPAAGQDQPAMAEQLLALANQSRVQAGAAPLQWDQNLATAAIKHCARMVVEGPIEHRYSGELDLSERAALAGAHFSLIEENIALGPYPATIHEGWMNSPGHRSNLLNREVDRVGIAVMANHGELYAVADYARGVQALTSSQVEAAVGNLIRMSGVALRKDPADARAACATSGGLPRGLAGGEPGFVMRWQGADLQHLPQALVDRLGSGRYHMADVGSCPAQGSDSAFSAYRLAVLLY